MPSELEVVLDRFQKCLKIHVCNNGREDCVHFGGYGISFIPRTVCNSDNPKTCQYYKPLSEDSSMKKLNYHLVEVDPTNKHYVFVGYGDSDAAVEILKLAQGKTLDEVRSLLDGSKIAELEKQIDIMRSELRYARDEHGC
jgi:hypothetical protein